MKQMKRNDDIVVWFVFDFIHNHPTHIHTHSQLDLMNRKIPTKPKDSRPHCTVCIMCVYTCVRLHIFAVYVLFLIKQQINSKWNASHNITFHGFSSNRSSPHQTKQCGHFSNVTCINHFRTLRSVHWGWVSISYTTTRNARWWWWWWEWSRQLTQTETFCQR